MISPCTKSFQFLHPCPKPSVLRSKPASQMDGAAVDNRSSSWSEIYGCGDGETLWIYHMSGGKPSMDQRFLGFFIRVYWSYFTKLTCWAVESMFFLVSQGGQENLSRCVNVTSHSQIYRKMPQGMRWMLRFHPNHQVFHSPVGFLPWLQHVSAGFCRHPFGDEANDRSIHVLETSISRLRKNML